MLVQASELYTPKNFEKFKEEYEEYPGAFIKEQSIIALTHKYIVAMFGQQLATCTCGKFESYGILRSHALKVLSTMDMKLIPEHYILKR